MTRYLIVPNTLSVALHVAIDSAIQALPEGERTAAEADRDALYQQLLAYFDEHGTVPEFSLEKK